MKKVKIKNTELLHDKSNESKLKNNKGAVAVLPSLYAKSRSKDDSEIIPSIYNDINNIANNFFSSQSSRELPTINPPNGNHSSFGDHNIPSVLPVITLEISRNIATANDTITNNQPSIGLFSLSQLNEVEYDDDNNAHHSIVPFSNTINKSPMKPLVRLPQLPKKLREDIHLKAVTIKAKVNRVT